MKEKLVEEWLIRARERGGIDHAFGQWLISQGHEILWLGHSPTEFGKDIISIAPDGQFHAYQLKDEDIDTKELRKIRDQLTELVEIPPVHPRVPHGSPHVAHLVTSGLFTEPVTLQVRTMNEGWSTRGCSQLVIIGRNDLIPRFVRMSDAFWPEKPADIRDFFSFYLAEGRGDFDPKKFSSVLRGLLPLSEEAPRRKAQRLAAVGLLGNYLLNPFEREGDHWSLFQGWTMVAAHQAWFGSKAGMLEKEWKPSFNLAKQAAGEHLNALSTECLAPGAFEPQDIEIDDYTRCRNLILAAVIAITDLIGRGQVSSHPQQAKQRLEMLLQNGRLCAWSENAVPHLLLVQWYAEKHKTSVNAMQLLEKFISELCGRNDTHSTQDAVLPPLVSADEALTELFSESNNEKKMRSRGTWSLETLLHFLVRKESRNFLSQHWREISYLEMESFQSEPLVDALLWDCPDGREFTKNPNKEQSWKELVNMASEDRSEALPQVLREDQDFALMFCLAYPHRLSPALIGFLDSALRAAQ